MARGDLLVMAVAIGPLASLSPAVVCSGARAAGLQVHNWLPFLPQLIHQGQA